MAFIACCLKLQAAKKAKKGPILLRALQGLNQLKIHFNLLPSKKFFHLTQN